MVRKVAIPLLFVTICSPSNALEQGMCGMSDTNPTKQVDIPDKDALNDYTAFLQLPVATVSGADDAMTLLNAGAYGSREGNAEDFYKNCQSFKCNQVNCANHHPTNMAPEDQLPKHVPGEVVVNTNPKEVPAAPEWTRLGGRPEAGFCKEKYEAHDKVCWRIRARKVNAMIDSFTPQQVCASCQCRQYPKGTRVMLNIGEAHLTAGSKGTIQPTPVSNGAKDIRVRWDGHPPTVQSVPAESISSILEPIVLGQFLSCDKNTYTIGAVMGSGSKQVQAIAYRVTLGNNQFVWKRTGSEREVNALELLKGATDVNQLVDLCNAGGVILSIFPGTPADTWEELRDMPEDRKQTVLDKLALVSKEILSKGVVDADRSPIASEHGAQQSHNTLIDAKTGAVMAIDFDLAETCSNTLEMYPLPKAAELYELTIKKTVFVYAIKLDEGTRAHEWVKKGIAALKLKFTNVPDNVIRAAATRAIISGAILTRDPHLLGDTLTAATTGDLFSSTDNPAADMARVLQDKLSDAIEEHFPEQVEVLLNHGAQVSQFRFSTAMSLNQHELIHMYMKHLSDEKTEAWLVELFKKKCDRKTGFSGCNPRMLSRVFDELGRLEYNFEPLFKGDNGRFTKSLCSAMFPHEGAMALADWRDDLQTMRTQVLASMNSLGAAHMIFLAACPQAKSSEDAASEEEGHESN